MSTFERYQSDVRDWITACFGTEIRDDRVERNHRFLEEALELVQSCEMSRDEAHALVDFVFDRPAGEIAQEVGGVMNTLAALCCAQRIELGHAARAELERVWEKIDEVRARRAGKPMGHMFQDTP